MLPHTFTKYAIKLKLPSAMYHYKRKDGSIDSFMWSHDLKSAAWQNFPPGSADYREAELALQFHKRSAELMKKIVKEWKREWKAKKK
jgi:hypothetical protein